MGMLRMTMMNGSDLIKEMQNISSARGKRNHELIGPYVTEFDTATGPRMQKLAEQIPVEVRQRIAKLKPFELYCLLASIDAEFPTKDKDHAKEKAGD